VKRARRAVQLGFFALVLGGVFVVGADCERWCPFGGVEAVYTYASEGDMLCSLGTSNFFILGGVLAMTLLLRRAFCGYMCPLGAISEWLHDLSRRLGLPKVQVAHRLDRALALLKYVVLAVILTATWRAGELVFRGFDPCYALISRHGADITYWAYVIAGAIAVASLVMVIPFCRWLCPFAAVLNPLAKFGLTRVKRDEEICRACGLCSESCPAAIPVDRLEQVTSARCMSCMNCVDACPHNGTDRSALDWGPPKLIGHKWSQAALIAILLSCTTLAVGASYMFPVPSFVKNHGTPTDELSTVRLKVENLTCRGRANLFFYFLERDDMYEIPGYFKVEAWPGAGLAEVDVTYDPTVTDEDSIKRAITEPYYDAVADFWRSSPFRIEGYDPLAIDGDAFGNGPAFP
jgi:ferredoxin